MSSVFKLQPRKGIDFSIRIVKTGKSVTIPTRQQMVIANEIVIEADAEVKIKQDAELAVVN